MDVVVEYDDDDDDVVEQDDDDEEEDVVVEFEEVVALVAREIQSNDEINSNNSAGLPFIITITIIVLSPQSLVLCPLPLALDSSQMPFPSLPPSGQDNPQKRYESASSNIFFPNCFSLSFFLSLSLPIILISLV